MTASIHETHSPSPQLEGSSTEVLRASAHPGPGIRVLDSTAMSSPGPDRNPVLGKPSSVKQAGQLADRRDQADLH